MYYVIPVGTVRLSGGMGRRHEVRGVTGFLIFYMELGVAAVFLSEEASEVNSKREYLA